MKNILRKASISVLALVIVMAAIAPIFNSVNAQTEPTTDVTDSKFKLSICDGPDKSKLPGGNPPGYVPCNFNGLMKQVQFLINMAIIFGVLVAIAMFTYAGFLYMTGKQDSVKHAKEIFRKTIIGFIMMLAAWLIVYEVLNLLTGGSGFTGLFKKTI